MSKIFINGTPYDYPNNGRDGGTWGEDATGAFEELVALVSSLTGNGYISESTVNLENNISTLTDIPSLEFNSTISQTAVIKYVINVNATSKLTEEGTLTLRFEESSSSWKMTRDYTGQDSQVFMDTTSSGQVQYKTPSYSGFIGIEMKFKTANIMGA